MTIADQAMREDLLEAVIGASLDCVIVIDEPGRVLEFNPAAERTFGYARADALGRSIAELIIPERHRAAHAAGLARLVATGEPRLLGRRVEIEALRADGSEFPVELTLAEVRAGGRRLFVASLRDLTQQRRSEQALRDSEARLAGFMMHAPIGMYLKDAEGRYLLANPEMAQVFGRPVNEVLGKTAGDLLTPEVAAMVAEQDALVRAELRPVALEERTDGRDDYTWALVVRFPVDRGEGIEIGGFYIDITALRRSEEALDRSREALVQAEKLAAMGSLLAGVSHELNNPLAAMIGQAIMLEEDLAGRPEAERAAKVRTAAERCGKIVQSFLAMARQRPPVRQPVDVNAVVHDALRIASYGLRTASIAVEDALADGLPQIQADPDQLHQVVINLIVNAQQSLQGQVGARRIRVASRCEADRLVIEVADNGPGVSPQVAPRIFEPFFTTKPMGSGTGVGLSLAHGILAAHGGRIELDEAQDGACFRITLPIDCEASGETAAPSEPYAVAARHVLVVDDEPDVADTLAEMLRRMGLRVTVALGAGQARKAVAQGGIDLVLSDLGMPGEDGIALHGWLCEAYPALAAQTAFVTGDTLGARAQAFLRDSGQPVIEKPFTPASLRAALAELDR